MYSIAISFASGALTGLLVSLWLGALPAVIPALIVTMVVMFLLTRRLSAQVQAEMESLMPMMEARDIEGATKKLHQIKADYGRWQILLDGQMDAQIGMLDYLQLKFDEALPKLQSGSFRNWTALACIGCIHYRRNRKDEAWKAFEAAANADSKHPILYLVWATLLVRDNLRDQALVALDRGLAAMPDNRILKDLKQTVANKKQVKTDHFPQTWYQFFPEDVMKQMMVRGRKGPLPEGAPQMPQQPRIGASRAPRR